MRRRFLVRMKLLPRCILLFMIAGDRDVRCAVATFRLRFFWFALSRSAFRSCFAVPQIRFANCDAKPDKLFPGVFPGPPNFLLHGRGLSLKWLPFFCVGKGKANAKSCTLAWQVRHAQTSILEIYHPNFSKEKRQRRRLLRLNGPLSISSTAHCFCEQYYLSSVFTR